MKLSKPKFSVVTSVAERTCKLSEFSAGTAGEEEDEDWWNDFYQFIEEGTRTPPVPSGP